MKNKARENHIIDLIFALSLFAGFVISSIFIVLLGARCYEGVSARMNANYTSRTAITYMTEKLRHRDVTGCTNIVNIDELPVIYLMRQDGAGIERTYIYSYEGYLRELSLSGEEEVDLSQGQPLIALKSFSARKISGSVYYISLTDTNGNTDYAYICEKCEPEVKGSAMAAPQ